MRPFDLVRGARASACPLSMDGRARVLVIPGLHGSGPAHWQTWLQAQYADAVRVEQGNWQLADLDRWARCIDRTVRTERAGTWIAVAHSFGCLALARYLQQHRGAVTAALLVAPADPRKFGVTDRLPLGPLGVPCTLIASDSDPWMRRESAGAWALLWAARYVNLGAVGHINTESGFGPLPIAKQIVDRMRALGPEDSGPRIAPRHDAVLRFAV